MFGGLCTLAALSSSLIGFLILACLGPSGEKAYVGVRFRVTATARYHFVHSPTVPDGSGAVRCCTILLLALDICTKLI